MSSFEEIGLREELLRTLEEEEITDPTALQAAVLATLRRGGNLIARASSGAGKTLAYGLGILDRLAEEAAEGDGEEGPRALVLTATPGEARRVALRLAPFAQATGTSVSALGSGWGIPAGEVGMLVAAAADAMEAIRLSTVKLDSLRSLVIDGASEIQNLGAWSDVDAILDLIPRDAQRVLLTAEWKDEIEDIADRRIKKALRYPAGRSDGAAAKDATDATLAYVVVGSDGKLELLAAQLRNREAGGAPPVIFTRSDERTAELAEQLAARGFLVGAPGDEEADLILAESGITRADLLDEADEIGQTISFDVPADVGTLKARHEGDASAVVMVHPRQVNHLRQIAREAGFEAESAPLPSDTTAVSRALRAFRGDVARAIREEDLTAQMLILEPLLDEFSAIEVAAALAAMVRAKRPLTPVPAAPETTASAEPQTQAPGIEKSPAPGPAPVTWTRLYVGVGSKEEVKPGDLVGALAGEADIPGSKIGKIEIRESFSVVEVEAAVAEKVIRAVNGTTIKGRSVRVDYDRGGPARRPGPGRGGARGGPPRRNTRRPPRNDR